MIKKINYINFVNLFIIINLICLEINGCDHQTTPIIVADPGITYEYPTRNLEVVIAYTPGSNSYRPLGNDPRQGLLSVVENAFNPVAFDSKNFIVRNTHSDPIYEKSLDIRDDRTAVNFFLKYCDQNNIIDFELGKLVVFGVARFFVENVNTVGKTFAFRKNREEINNRLCPAFTFVIAGYIDSVYKARIPTCGTCFTDEQRKKMIRKVFAHELAHCRGLIDDDVNPPFYDPHMYHQDNDTALTNTCAMHYLGSIANRIASFDPPRFCLYHQTVMRNFLQTKIRQQFDIPAPP